jgi:hypothetical protein
MVTERVSTGPLFKIVGYAEKSGFDLNLFTSFQHEPFEALVKFNIAKNRLCITRTFLSMFDAFFGCLGVSWAAHRTMVTVLLFIVIQFIRHKGMLVVHSLLILVKVVVLDKSTNEFIC